MEVSVSKSVVYRCPGCEGQFRYFHHPDVESDPAPRFCPMCGYDTEADDVVVKWPKAVVAPHIAQAIGKIGDQTYRQIEAGSEARAQAAADMLGVPKSEMSGMKVTDLNDNLREGDVAAKMPVNPVSQAMQTQPGTTGWRGGPEMAQYAASIHAGPDSHAGLHAKTMISNYHQTNAHQIVAAGRLNKA